MKTSEMHPKDVHNLLTDIKSSLRTLPAWAREEIGKMVTEAHVEAAKVATKVRRGRKPKDNGASAEPVAGPSTAELPNTKRKGYSGAPIVDNETGESLV
jgi:hypothetical protein